MLKMLKVFWVLTPPFLLDSFFQKNASHWGNVKNVKNLKGLLTRKVLKTGEMLKMLKMLKVFWVLAPPFPPFFLGGGVKTQKTFNIFNIFNISPVLSTFFVSNPFKFLTFLTFPQWEGFFPKKECKRRGGGVKTQKTFNIFNISPVLSTFFVGRPFKILTFLTFPLF